MNYDPLAATNPPPGSADPGLQSPVSAQPSGQFTHPSLAGMLQPQQSWTSHDLANATASITSPPQQIAEDWSSIFQAAKLPPAAVEKYTKIFEEQEMPPPTTDTVRWYLDNAFLLSLGVEIAGHRALILSTCRKASTKVICTGCQMETGSQLTEPATPGSLIGPSNGRPLKQHGLHAGNKASHHDFVGSATEAPVHRLQLYRDVSHAVVDDEDEEDRDTIQENSGNWPGRFTVNGGDRSERDPLLGTRASNRTNSLAPPSHRQSQAGPRSSAFSPTLENNSIVGTEYQSVQLDAMRFAQVDDSQLLRPDIVQVTEFKSAPDSRFREYTWIDISGRDKERKEFKRALQEVTKRFGFSESLLLDMDLSVALPQVITTQEEDQQYVVILRVATERTDIEEDSLHELTNRWMVAVNLANHTVVTIHRVDSIPLAKLRLGWSAYEINQLSFHALVCKIFDDSIVAYIDALAESEFLLDKYEGVMLRHSVGGSNKKKSDKKKDVKVSWFDKLRGRGNALKRAQSREEMANFGSLTTRSKDNVMPLLLLEEQDKLTKQRMNQLLYHLHRRASVYSRMLSLTQAALESAYSSIRICSAEYAEQMSRSCGELALKAESLHDNCQNLLNLHLSLVSFRTNELMNILTVFSAFFIPLTFISGVYGMNFDNMPELHLHYGYYYCLSAMLAITIGVFIFFRQKGLI